MDDGSILVIWFILSVLIAIGLNTYTKNSYDYEFLDDYPYGWIILCVIMVILGFIDPTSMKYLLFLFAFCSLIPPTIKNVQETDYTIGIFITFAELLVAPFYILYVIVIVSILKKI